MCLTTSLLLHVDFTVQTKNGDVYVNLQFMNIFMKIKRVI